MVNRFPQVRIDRREVPRLCVVGTGYKNVFDDGMLRLGGAMDVTGGGN